MVEATQEPEREFNTEASWDIAQFYDSAKSALDTGDLRQSLRLIQKGLDRIDQANEKKWLKKYVSLEEKVIKAIMKQRQQAVDTEYKAGNYKRALESLDHALEFTREHDLPKHAKKLESQQRDIKVELYGETLETNLSRGEQAMESKRFEKAKNYFFTAKTAANNLYKLGENNEKYSKMVKELTKHIIEAEKKMEMDALINEEVAKEREKLKSLKNAARKEREPVEIDSPAPPVQDDQDVLPRMKEPLKERDKENMDEIVFEKSPARATPPAKGIPIGKPTNLKKPVVPPANIKKRPPSAKPPQEIETPLESPKMEEKEAIPGFSEQLQKMNERTIEPEEDFLEFDSLYEEQLTEEELKDASKFLEEENELDLIALEEERKRKREASKEKENKALKAARLKRERNSESKLRSMADSAIMTLKNREYRIIPANHSLTKALFRFADVVALKVHSVEGQYTDIIHVIPIKIFPMKGPLMVSDKIINYRTVEGIQLDQEASQEYVNPAKTDVETAADMIYSSISNCTNFFKFLKRHLRMSLEPERSILSKKVLFLRFGAVLYKVVVDPVLLCTKAVPNDSLIQFPYYKKANLHVLEPQSLMNLVTFLGSKYQLIEQYSDQSNIRSEYDDAFAKHVNHTLIAGTPMLIYGILMLTLGYLLKLVPAYQVLMMAFIPLIASCSIILIFLRVKYELNKSEIRKANKSRYHERRVRMDDNELLLLADDLGDDKLMQQFMYECFGKKRHVDLSFLDAPKSSKKSSKIKRQESEASFPDLTEKYKDFLED